MTNDPDWSALGFQGRGDVSGNGLEFRLRLGRPDWNSRRLLISTTMKSPFVPIVSPPPSTSLASAERMRSICVVVAAGGVAFAGSANGATLARSMATGVDGLSAAIQPAAASPSLVMKTRKRRTPLSAAPDAAAATTQSGRRADDCAIVAARPCQCGEMSSLARALK